MRAERDSLPRSERVGAGGREVERSETNDNPAYTTRRASVAPRILGGAPLAPPSSIRAERDSFPRSERVGAGGAKSSETRRTTTPRIRRDAPASHLRSWG